MKSPISLALGGVELPELFRLQFCHSSELPYSVKLSGHLHHIWYRPAWIYPILWLLEKAGILISEKGRMVYTTLHVTACTDASSKPVQMWRRRFYGNKIRNFDVKVVYDPESNRAVDLVGHGGVLALAWNIRHENNLLNIDVIKAGFRLFNRYFWLPDWIWPFLLGKETFTQRIVNEREQRVSIELIITHPLLGKIFGYDGEFTLEKVLPLEEGI